MKDESGNWRPQTWGDILRKYAEVDPATPVFEVTIRSATIDLKVTDTNKFDVPFPTGWKGWKKEVERLREKVEC